MSDDFNSYLNEVNNFTRRLTNELGVHSFRGRDYRSIDGEIQVFDTEEKRWMNIREALGKSISKLGDLIFGDDTEEEEDSRMDDLPKNDSYEDESEESLNNFGFITDVDVDGYDVTCTFNNGEKQTAHCHLADIKKWSLETGISVCLGKHLAGGSSEYNRIVRKGMKCYKDKIKAHAKMVKDRMEEERILENKKRKRERYLKRRAERLGNKKESGFDISVNPETSTVILKKDGKLIQISVPNQSSLFEDLLGLFQE